MAKRRLRSDSAAKLIAGYQGALDVIEPPEGVTFDNDEERLVWDQWTRRRAREDWTDGDLLQLAKVVRLEVDIRRHSATLRRAGPLIKDRLGGLTDNPLVRVVDTLQRQQLALIRSMGLNQTESDPRTINAKPARDKAPAPAGFGGFLARPSRKWPIS